MPHIKSNGATLTYVTVHNSWVPRQISPKIRDINNKSKVLHKMKIIMMVRSQQAPKPGWLG